MEPIIDTQVQDGNVLMKVSGEVDVSTAQLLRDALSQIDYDAVDQIQIDLTKTSYIDSTGIGVLVGVAKRAHEHQKAFKIINPQPNVMRVLSLLGVGQQFNVEFI